MIPPRECGAPGLLGDAPRETDAERKAKRIALVAKLQRQLARLLGPNAVELVMARVHDHTKDAGRLTLAVDESDGDGYAVAFLEDGAFLTISTLMDSGKIGRVTFRTDGEAGRVLRDVVSRVVQDPDA